jgi:hypothetical protein
MLGLNVFAYGIAPGQAVTFAVYEVVYGFLTDMSKKISVAESENVGVSATHSNDE